MKQRESGIIRAAFCALASRRIQILEPRHWSKFAPPPFRAADNAIRGVAWRQNTGGAEIGRRFVNFGLRGQCDIAGLMRGGQAFGIECKCAGQVPTPYQTWYHDFFGGLGMWIAVVRSYEDTINILDRWGIT